MSRGLIEEDETIVNGLYSRCTRRASLLSGLTNEGTEGSVTIFNDDEKDGGKKSDKKDSKEKKKGGTTVTL